MAETRTCPQCGTKWVSADSQNTWTCDVCGAEIPRPLRCKCTRLTDEHIRAALEDKPRRVWRPQKLLLNLILVAGFAYMCWLAATDLLPAAIDHELDRMPTADVMATPVAVDEPAEPETMTMLATAYSYGCGNGDGLTATGTPIRPGVVAVDPTVIELGSTVEIVGLGTFQAEDTGGAIRGNRVDIFMPSRGDCIQFGRQMVEVRIIEPGL